MLGIESLILARGVHIATTVLAAGTVSFMVLAAEPAAARATNGSTPVGLLILRRRLTLLVWIALAVAIVSGATWLMLLAADILGESIVDVDWRGGAWMVLTETRFGEVGSARLTLALLLGLLMLWPAMRLLQLMAAAGLVALLAFVGHAGATPGLAGRVHLASDIVHLVAASAWLGGLLPFALLLNIARRSADKNWQTVSVAAAHRFSVLGILSVGALLATGIINTWNLVGSIDALTGTNYGLLLLVKISLFAAMIYFAAINRLRLTPRLPEIDALRRLHHNSLIEVGLGLCIVGIVGVLGRLPPAIQSHMHVAHVLTASDRQDVTATLFDHRTKTEHRATILLPNPVAPHDTE